LAIPPSRSETVFHTKKEFLGYSPLRRALVSTLRHPVVFFTMAPLLTWWVKMRLPIEIGGGVTFPKSAYSFSNKMLFLSALILQYRAAYQYGFLDVLFLSGYFGAVSPGGGSRELRLQEHRARSASP
jgi:hypothetical protein